MSKIWMTRDLKGDDDRIYVWNKKPTWDQESCTYDCSEQCDHGTDEYGTDECESSIVILSPTCGDICKILKSLGVKNSGVIPEGGMIEITNSKISQGITLADKAHDLAKRIKSQKKKPTQKELVTFLNSITQDVVVIKDEDEDEDGDEENGCND